MSLVISLRIVVEQSVVNAALVIIRDLALATFLELDTTEAQQRQRLHPQFSFKIPQTSSVVTVSHSFQTIVVFRIIGSAVL
jgi:hypothetical protein